MRGMSNGTIVAIVVVVVALLVTIVALAFMLQSHTSSEGLVTSSSQPTTSISYLTNTSSSSYESGLKPVMATGPAYIVYNSTTRQVLIEVQLINPNSVDLQITGVSINNVPVTLSSNQNLVVPPGNHMLNVTGTVESQLTAPLGSLLAVMITLNDGQIIVFNAMVVDQTG